MNYGDPTNSVSGRAQVPGARGGPDADGAARGATGTASVRGSASVSSGPIGRASVGGAAGRASVGASAGRAQVGRASAGRASVGPSITRPASGRAFVSGSEMSGGEFGAREFGGRDDLLSSGPGSRPPTSRRSSASKRRRRRNILIAGFAAFIMISGIAVIGGTYYYDDVNVNVAELQGVDQSTTIYYSDGKTPMAKLGAENRTVIPQDKIPLDMKHAMVAAEDLTFYSNNGVDFKGIARAAVNNVTGGERQGASTITQQYARKVADLNGISYSRKLREAVIAMKLSKELPKDEILANYLNIVYFGRSAYGIQAAAQAYFGKDAKDLTLAEGMVLAGLVKQPEGDTPEQASPYDPTRNPESAKDRWEYIRGNLLKLNFVDKAKVDALQYPTNVKKYDLKDFAPQFGLDKPTGFVVHQVMDEMYHAKDAAGRPQFPELKAGGASPYSVVTTIDPVAQKAAETYGDPANKASPLYGQPDNLQAAIVSIEPGTGRVKAYYGGPDGSKNDYAGIWRDPILTTDADNKPNDQYQGFGGHPAGSSFKIYALGAALTQGISVNSYWDGSDSKEFPKWGRTKGSANGPVTNSSTGKSCKAGPEHCQLWEATEQSLNTPFYGVADKIGPNKVLQFAYQAGIKHIWRMNEQGVEVRQELDQLSPTDQYWNSFSPELAIGQYKVTVLDHANGVATLANRGKAAAAHFVQSVSKAGQVFYREAFKAKQVSIGTAAYTPQMADDQAWAMQKVMEPSSMAQDRLGGGRPSAGKTGTWQLDNDPKHKNDNAHAYMVGFTAGDSAKRIPGLATAVWVGNKGNEQAIKYYPKGSKTLSPIFGSNMPGPIWKNFMDAALKGTPVVKFPEPKYVGDENGGNAQPPAKQPDPTCAIPQLCPSGAPSADNSGPGNGNGGNGGGAGQTCGFFVCPDPSPTRRR